MPACTHQPPCPPADSPHRAMARLTVYHPSQGWGLACNGIIRFHDAGEILPNGKAVYPPRRRDDARPAVA